MESSPTPVNPDRKAPLDWLLAGAPWIVYRTRRDLLGQSETDPPVQSARLAMLKDTRIRTLVNELAAWPGKVLSSHKSASQPFHKLTFLADLGLTVSDPGVTAIVVRIRKHTSGEGPFQLPMNIPRHFGGSGREQWAWALCDAPLIVYALAGLGLARAPDVTRAVRHLAGLVCANGWPCAVARELGSFRGPGRRDDPCPFATLAMLKLLAILEDYSDSPATRQGAEILLTLWQESRRLHPYIFYMGTDFRKLKVPFVWYDLLHVLEVLSRFVWLRQDPRLQDMLAVLRTRMDARGRFTCESVWTAWKDWEFGQKREPSRWLTLLAWRIIQRCENGI